MTLLVLGLVLTGLLVTVAGRSGPRSRLRGLAPGARRSRVGLPVRVDGRAGRDPDPAAGTSAQVPVHERPGHARDGRGRRHDRVDRPEVAIGRRGAFPRTATSRRSEASVEVDAVLVLALVEAALTTGSAIPTAVAAVGRAIGGTSGAALQRAGSALVLGATWSTAWSGVPAPVRPVRDALETAWVAGAPPVPGLRARAERLRRERRRAVRTAAARLAVHLVLPLGACFLPAFVLVGLVPIVLSLTDGLALLP